MRTLPLAFLLLSAAACAPGTVSFDEGTSGLGTGWATEPFETYEGTTTATDDGLSAYDDAVLTVLSPSPSEFIPLGTVAVFEAEIVGRDGTVLESPIEWQSTQEHQQQVQQAPVETRACAMPTRHTWPAEGRGCGERRRAHAQAHPLTLKRAVRQAPRGP